MKDTIFIHFLGAAGTVTGSKYLIEAPEKKFLVDCGLFQGLKQLRLLNWDHLPVDVPSIDFVLLTHGHLDHVGYLPRLIKDGFKGKVYGTAPTLDIAEIILRDSARLQEEEAEQANKEGFSKHHPAKPFYTEKDVESTLTHFSTIDLNQWIDLGGQVKARFQTNGHIIGSTFIEVHVQGKKFVFSGDVDQEDDLLLMPPKKPTEADILFVESTYGDRLHPEGDVKERLKTIVLETIARGGSVIIPSFAVERTQVMMYLLWQLRISGELPDVPLIMDSPMGARVLGVFEKHRDWHKLPTAEYTAMCEMFQVVEDYRETMNLIDTKYPKIIIAGSGMVTGGRVLSYLQHYIEYPQHTVLLVGYQGEGTRGRQLLEGTHEIKIHGKYYPVKSHVEILHGLSAHGDQTELLHWMSDIKKAPEHIFVIHGEKQAADTFQVKIKDTFGWQAVVPNLYEIVEIPII
ncbi:MAG: MBL fold metallo-hydrolase [Lewinellaceae bacterium]|nr:MBL fold metallo-hydrolase [Lewinellaceae bacterium]